MTRKDVSFLLFLLLVSLGFVACETERDPCLLPKTVYVRTGIYRVSDTGNVSVDSGLRNPVWGPLDSFNKFFIFPPGTNKFYSLITLNPNADSSTWVMIPDTANRNARDTITFYYTRKLKFLNNACGYIYNFSLNSVRFTPRSFGDPIHSIDSAIISVGGIDGNNNVENLKIYIHKPQ